jgi:hypothetical protein
MSDRPHVLTNNIHDVCFNSKRACIIRFETIFRLIILYLYSSNKAPKSNSGLIIINIGQKS